MLAACLALVTMGASASPMVLALEPVAVRPVPAVVHQNVVEQARRRWRKQPGLVLVGLSLIHI